MGLEFETTVVYECRGEAAARAYLVAAPTTDIDRETLATFRISGHVVGPTCRYSSTLQARIPLAHRGLTMWGGRSAVSAEAIVPDPCYWSTELPFLYRAVGKIEVHNGDTVNFDQVFGMRDLAVVRNRLILNGKVWVPRIVYDCEVLTETPLDAWRETDTVLFSSKPTDELLHAASEIGVPVAVAGAHERAIELHDLRRLGRFPAVMIVKMDGWRSLDAKWKTPSPNVLLARWYDEQLGDLSDEATDLYFVRVDPDGRPFENEMKEWPVGFRRPLIPVIPLGRTLPLAEARAGCDRLQRRLAGHFDPAGYLV